jgi:hypothetical protein
MTCHLAALCVDARDPLGVARFWAGLLGGEPVPGPQDAVTLLPGEGTGVPLQFEPSREPKAGQNRIHLDLTTTSAEHQQRTVADALAGGGRHVDVGQRPDETHVVLADPEGNEFCVIEPGNRFLAGCGRLGAINCDGTRELGYFWSRALDRPLVWDQDGETALRSPGGGPMISWSGPPLMPRTGRDRLRLAVAPDPGSGQAAEVEHLVALGAVHRRQEADGAVTMVDPDGNEFRVLPAR